MMPSCTLVQIDCKLDQFVNKPPGTTTIVFCSFFQWALGPSKLLNPNPPILILCFWQHIPAYWPAFWLCVYWTGFTPSQSAYNLVWTVYKLVKGLKSGCNIYTWWYMHTNTENVRNHKQFVGRHTYTPGRAFLSSCSTLPSSGSIRYCSSALSSRRTVRVVTPL